MCLSYLPTPPLGQDMTQGQSISSRIWTRVVVSISYDDNHYTTGTSSCNVFMEKKISKFDKT